MKLTAQHNQDNHEISFERDGEHVIALVDGHRYDITAREINDGLYLLMRGGEVYECLIESQRDKQDSFTVRLRNRTYETTVLDPRRLSNVHTSRVHAGNGSAQITSPMPGKVVRVLVQQGALVKTGDGLVVVEAMKMQNELKALCDGVVAELPAVEGVTVEAGEVLAVIEPHAR